jgi:hypothetical protein
MKCIKNQSGIIDKVPDEEAKELLLKGWVYCPKSEWKKMHKSSTEPERAKSTQVFQIDVRENGVKGGGKFRKEIPNDRKRERRIAKEQDGKTQTAVTEPVIDGTSSASSPSSASSATSKKPLRSTRPKNSKVI